MTIFTGARLDHTSDPMAVSRARGSFCVLCGTNTGLMPWVAHRRARRPSSSTTITE